MTILTPTNNPDTAGLPDQDTLNRMAGELFAMLPGDPQGIAQLISGFAPRSLPVMRNAGLNAGLPVSTPTELPPGLPPSLPLHLTDNVPSSLPANSPTTVPSNFPSNVPTHAPTAPVNARPDTANAPEPYYFLEYANANRLASQHPQQFDGLTDGRQNAAPSQSQSFVPQSGQLPGQDPLVALIGELFPSPKAAAQVHPATPATPASSHAPRSWDTAPNQTLQGQPATGHAQHSAFQAHAPFDIHAVRRDFPILSERVNGRPLVWFDNAATMQKPQAVIDRISYFYAHENSNIHRAAHELAARATDAYEGARDTVARFIGARSSSEIIFVRGTTEGINLIAQTFGKQHIGKDDEIIVSHLEHHANIVPWQLLCKQTGAKLRVIPVDDSGQIILSEFSKLLNSRTRLVSVTQVSNALGTVTPIQEIIALAHRAGARVLVDGAQGISHMPVNVQQLDADFYVFSGHKIVGPTGIGAVYGKQELLDQLPPWQGGGNMIADVTFEHTQYQPAPSRFEAGTGNIADAVGLGAALEYIERIGIMNIARYEHALLEYATHGLLSIPGLRLIGTAANKASVSSFVMTGYKTEEIGRALNQEGIAVRSGHHCAQPILRRFGVETTVRPSLAFYNTCEEIDHMIAVLRNLSGSRRA